MDSGYKRKLEHINYLQKMREETTKELIKAQIELAEAKEAFYLTENKLRETYYKTTFGIDSFYAEKSLLKEVDKIINS